MQISLETVQELAPDQASLNAAKKLLKPVKWPLLGQGSLVNSVWGECQGSGSKPYYTMADVVDHGYKCTCPSRKFPCKHVLALLWQFSDGPSNFVESAPPQWVLDWLGRRRRPSGTAKSDVQDSKEKVKKDINATEVIEKKLSSEEVEKRETASKKRAIQNKAKTEASINDGLVEFQQWLDDQLVNGISTFIKEINERCRQIASRLVDAKATNFASRVDELPSKVLSLPAPSQPEAVYKELGKLALLSEAWFTDCDDIDIRRAVATGENREQVLNHPQSIRVNGIWETVGERVETRKDGLVAHSKWLLRLDNKEAQLALLLDYYPAASGRKEMIASVGRRIKGKLIFYPSRTPARAILGEHSSYSDDKELALVEPMDHEKSFQLQMSLCPWMEAFPCLLGKGKILKDEQGSYWWRSLNEERTLSLRNTEINPVLTGAELENAFIISDGVEAELLSATAKSWGIVSC